MNHLNMKCIVMAKKCTYEWMNISFIVFVNEHHGYIVYISSIEIKIISTVSVYKYKN